MLYSAASPRAEDSDCRGRAGSNLDGNQPPPSPAARSAPPINSLDESISSCDLPPPH
jgi:hypothetical protein